MEISTILYLLAIGVCAGIMSGFIGIGGGVVMVPALIYFLGLTQHEAQGLSIATMLPPIGILAFYNYYQNGAVTKNSIVLGSIIAVAFIAGGYFGSKLSLKLSPNLVKLIFGCFMLFVAFKMIIGGLGYFAEDND